RAGSETVGFSVMVCWIVGAPLLLATPWMDRYWADAGTLSHDAVITAAPIGTINRIRMGSTPEAAGLADRNKCLGGRRSDLPAHVFRASLITGDTSIPTYTRILRFFGYTLREGQFPASWKRALT